MKNNLKNKSRFLSLILRHKPKKAGIIIDKNGWTDVKELLNRVDFDFSTLDEIVETNEKKRFAFNSDKTKIRASQGHSINVDLKLTPHIPPEILYHGTADKFIKSIKKKGLIAGKRNHVHLSRDIETAVKVGKRHGKPIILIINSIKMFKDKHEFYLSDNGVWLTKSVPKGYIQK